MADILQKGFAAQAQALREFGYTDVTASDVKAAHADWMAGKEPSGIVAHFCVSAFEDYPEIFGQPSADAQNVK